MNDNNRPDLYNRTLAIHQLAKVDEQYLPPVAPSSADEFARLMQRQSRTRHEASEKEPQQRKLGWDRFKQCAFRFADKILSPEKLGRGSRRIDQGPGWKDLPDTAGRRPQVDIEDETAPLTGRGLLMRLGASLFRDRPASDLSHDLAECVRLADGFGEAWQLEIQLANEHLPGTRLHLSCDGASLHLRFVCADPRAASILRNNRMMLLTRMGGVTARVVLMDVEETPGSDAVQGMTGGTA